MRVATSVIFHILFVFVTVNFSLSRYLACAPSYYGSNCSNVCDCAQNCICNDNIYGDGACICELAEFNEWDNFQDNMRNIKSSVNAPDGWPVFVNILTKELPVDQIKLNYVRQVNQAFCSIVKPTPIGNPSLIHANRDVAQIIHLNPTNIDSATFIEYFSGNILFKNSLPFAQNYGGHQFGSWSGQLGDGRAISIGQIQFDQNQILELQFKGSGRTPYSRRGDGRAVLRSSIREYLASEAMYHLNVPTSRCLSIIGSDDKAYRDEFYNGHGKEEKIAIVTRVAPSFIRFGTFELPYKRQEYTELRLLLVYVINHHFPHLIAAASMDDLTQSSNLSSICVLFYREVIQRTAKLIARWNSIGFAHGVMNTDNMSILGLTIDYGPFGFLDVYDPSFVPNYSDHDHRYAFERQADIGHWNLERLGEALSPLVVDGNNQALMTKELEQYYQIYSHQYDALMARKLGFVESMPVAELVNDYLSLMRDARADYTLSIRFLSSFDGIHCDPDQNTQLFDLFPISKHDQLVAFLQYYKITLAKFEIDEKERKERMDNINPRYILRNELAQHAITLADNGDYSEVDRLMELVKEPYRERNEKNPTDLAFLSQARSKGVDYNDISIRKRILVSCSS